MDLKQHLIHRNYKKCEAKNQMIIGDDYSVPDGKPDILKILQKCAELSVEEVATEKGKVRVRGKLKVDVFYLTQRSAQRVESLQMEFPFEEILYMDGAASGDNLKIDWMIEELKIQMIHPGKLNVRSIVVLQGVIKGCEEHLVTEDVEAEEHLQKKELIYRTAEPAIDRKDSYRIRDEVNLSANKTNVQKVLWQNLQLQGVDIRIQDGRLAVKGECHLFVVYEGEGDQESFEWFEQTIPFQGTLDVTGLTGEMFGTVETEISHRSVEVKPDYDGELRSFQIEVMLDIHMHLYEECDHKMLQDVYSTKELLNLEKKQIKYEKLRICNETKGRINGIGKIETDGKLLQIASFVSHITGKQFKIQEQGIMCEGVVEVQVLYLTTSDQEPFGCISAEIPYSQLIETSGIQKEDEWHVTESIDQMFVTMSEGNIIDIKGTLNFHVCVMEQCVMETIVGILREPYDLETYKKRPGMVIHFVQPKETLWELAKAYWTTTEEIQKTNELSTEEIISGQKLLLMKNSMETL